MSMSLEDSSTYQWIMKRGEARGETRGKRAALQNLLMSLGAARLGPPSAASAKIIGEIEDPARLELLVMGVLDAENWDELLRR